jgi:hypothetical protein
MFDGLIADYLMDPGKLVSAIQLKCYLIIDDGTPCPYFPQPGGME